PVPGRSAYLSWIATLPEYRGRGIATKLVERLVATSDSRGYPELQLASQAQAVGLYAQFGFERLGRPYVVRGIPHQAMARSLRIGR
ncbi:MAG: GNAT family N-acetyltransferase, partial [Thermomicrobiales bacterium]